MFKANKTLTVVHRVQLTGGDSYACWQFTGSWYRQNKVTVGSSGLQAAQLVKCRIPVWGMGCIELGRLRLLSSGDKVLRGELAECDGKTFAALGRTHGAATVLDVHINEDVANPHVYIEGAG